MKVKLCGFNEIEPLKVAINHNIDFAGFVFHQDSPRNIDFKQADKLANIVPKHVLKVAVVTNTEINWLKNINSALQPDYFQLHDHQAISDILAIKEAFPTIKIIKAISVINQESLKQGLDFIDVSDIMLFDGANSGSGKAFDWNILKNFSCQKNWFLSGGLNINNILEAIKITNAKMVDISSGIEKEKGKKSPELIEQLMKKIKNVYHN